MVISRYTRSEEKKQNKSFQISIAEKAAVSCAENIFETLKEHNGHRVVLFQLSQTSAFEQLKDASGSIQLPPNPNPHPHPLPAASCQFSQCTFDVRLVLPQHARLRCSPPSRNGSPGCQRPLLSNGWMQSHSADIEGPLQCYIVQQIQQFKKKELLLSLPRGVDELPVCL